LQGEHERIRIALAKLEATMKELRHGRPHSGREYVQWGEELVETVGDHLARENTALQAISVDGALEEDLALPPEGPRHERVNQLVRIAEELCQEYLQKKTALVPLRSVAEEVVGQDQAPVVDSAAEPD
jgi:hemerythrin-like domain-containing protein